MNNAIPRPEAFAAIEQILSESLAYPDAANLASKICDAVYLPEPKKRGPYKLGAKQ
jgi:hypothetical protein